jgi:hypothetical protein
MKVGDLVRAKNPIYFKGIGVIICDTINSPWENCLRVFWVGHHDGEPKALMRVYDLEPAF